MGYAHVEKERDIRSLWSRQYTRAYMDSMRTIVLHLNTNIKCLFEEQVPVLRVQDASKTEILVGPLRNKMCKRTFSRALLWKLLLGVPLVWRIFYTDLWVLACGQDNSTAFWAST
jgi:hypothetical protein